LTDALVNSVMQKLEKIAAVYATSHGTANREAETTTLGRTTTAIVHKAHSQLTCKR